MLKKATPALPSHFLTKMHSFKALFEALLCTLLLEHVVGEPMITPAPNPPSYQNFFQRQQQFQKRATSSAPDVADSPGMDVCFGTNAICNFWTDDLDPTCQEVEGDTTSWYQCLCESGWLATLQA